MCDTQSLSCVYPPYSLPLHEHSLDTSRVVLPGDDRTVAGHDQDCLSSGVVYPPRASSGPQCENRMMPCPAGAPRGVPKVSTNRGFMRTGTSFNASIPDVERFSLAIRGIFNRGGGSEAVAATVSFAWGAISTTSGSSLLVDALKFALILIPSRSSVTT